MDFGTELEASCAKSTEWTGLYKPDFLQ